MFDIGRLVAHIEMVGMQAFSRDLETGGKATEKLATQAETAGAKADRLSGSLDKTSKSSKDVAGSLDEAAKSAGGAAEKTTDAADATDHLGEANVEMAIKLERAHTVVGTALVGTGAAILALTTLAITKYAAFDKAMSEVVAVTGAASDEQMRLRDAAIEAGGATVFSAEEAAKAQANLAKAGVSTADILGGALAGSLSLAAAGNLDVAEAAEIAAVALVQFNLAGSKMPHVADLLAAGAGKAQGSVQDMGYALRQSGLVASQMGLSIEETTGTLAAFANAGLIGSDAGTSFRTMLLSLANPSGQANALLEQYNIHAYDAAGNMVSMSNLAGQLKSQLGGLTSAERDRALAVIFGTDAVRAANVLTREGSDGLAKWTNNVNDAGYAARFAADMQNNLAGDVEKLGGAFDSALIQTGSGANEVLRELTQTATELIDGFAGLPPEVQKGALELAIATGAALLLGGAFLLAVPKVVEFRLAVQTLTAAYPALMGGMRGAAGFLAGPWGIALVAATLGVKLLADYLDSLQASSTEIQASLLGAKTAADLFATAGKGKDAKWWTDVSADLADLDNVLQAAADQSENLFARFDSRHFGAFEALKEIGVELGALSGTNLPAAQNGFRLLAGETDGSRKRLWELLSQMPEYKQALIEQLTATGDYAETMTEAEKKSVLLEGAMGNAATQAEYTAGAYSGTAVEVEGLTLTIDELVDSLNKANGVQISAEEANIRYLDGLAKVAEYAAQAAAGVEGYSLTVDTSTQVGRDNRAMLLDTATAAQAVAEANLLAGGSAQAYKDEMEAGRDTFVKNLELYGMSADAAKRLGDELFKIPSDKEIDIILNTAAADAGLAGFRARLDSIARRSVTIDLNGSASGNGQMGTFAAGAILGVPGSVRRFANGGFNEQQVSQIGVAGQTRMWNEEPSYEETFISSNPAYRDRSLEILGITARKFGKQIVDQGSGAVAAIDSSPRGPVRMTGTLDLGNGLRGIVEGIIEETSDRNSVDDMGGSPL